MSAPDPAAAPAHPGADFDGCEPAPSTLVSERARFGLPTRPAGTPNRVRFVALARGEGWLVVDEAGGGR